MAASAASTGSTGSLTLSPPSPAGPKGPVGKVSVPVLDDYPLLGHEINSGSFGVVYELRGVSNQIVKVIKTDLIHPREVERSIRNLIQEVTIQQKLSELVPGVCPKVYEFGKIKDKNEYVIVMEKCEGTARSWLRNNGNRDDVVLDYLEQAAQMLKRTRPYNFNHRDLKSDNIMYKHVASRDPSSGRMRNRKKYLLIDFGFSCATFDGVRYEGTLYFDPGIKCFRESRDLALLVFELLSFRNLSPDMVKFLQLVLTFNYKGKKCDMSKGCLPDFDADWLSAYDFLDKDGVDNPNTTPDGLLRAVEAYRKGGIKECEKGFIDPMKDVCVPDPGPPADAALKPAMSPKPHMASPVSGDSMAPIPLKRTYRGGPLQIEFEDVDLGGGDKKLLAIVVNPEKGYPSKVAELYMTVPSGAARDNGFIHSFYVLPRVYKFSKEEQQEVKGLGKELICAVFGRLMKQGKLTATDKIGLEASGGSPTKEQVDAVVKSEEELIKELERFPGFVEDLKKYYKIDDEGMTFQRYLARGVATIRENDRLVEYYKTYGFKVVKDNVPNATEMVGTVQGIMSTCGALAKGGRKTRRRRHKRSVGKTRHR